MSPSGRTKNYVRFYETNRLPEPDSTKYNFQVIRKRFESNNSREKTDKKQCSAGVSFNFSNIHKNFVSNTKLIKHICHEKGILQNEFRPYNQAEYQENKTGSMQQKTEPNGTFNNLLQEIINTVEKNKSRRSIVRSRSKSKKNDKEDANRNNQEKTDRTYQ